MEPNEKYIEFINFLEKLNTQNNTQAISILKRSAKKEPGEYIPAYRYIEPYLINIENRWYRISFYMIAALFGVFPNNHNNKMDYGKLTRELDDPGGGIEKRFLKLLDADEDQVWIFIKNLHEILKASGKVSGVNYSQLLMDMLYWNSPTKAVQKRWAKSYYQEKF